MKQKQVFTIFFSLLFVLAFVSNGFAQWTQIGEPINGEQAYDRLGTGLSLSSDGETLAVTAPTSYVQGDSITKVQIYKLNNNNWIQVGNDLEGNIFHEGQTPIKLSGDGLTLVKGFPYESANANNSGAVRVYDVSNGEWEQIGDIITGDNGPYHFGRAVSISSDGHTVAVSAFNSTSYGTVHIFKLLDDVWVQQGEKIFGSSGGDLAGFSISLSDDGNVIAMGIPYSSDFMEYSGEVQVHSWQDDAWVQVGMDINGDNTEDVSGFSVNLASNGQTLIVGTPYATVDGNSSAGYVKVYENINGNWEEKGQKITGLQDDWLGYDTSISFDGNTIAIGAATHDFGTNGPHTGQVRSFTYSNSQWVPYGDVLTGSAPVNWFGHAVDLNDDGTILAIGAPRNGDIGNESGQVKVYELMPLSVEENDFAESVIIYPNPTQGLVTIKFDNQPTSGTISVLNLYGKTLLTQQVNGANSTLDLSALANSIYIIEVRNSEGVKVEKLVLDR